METPAAEGKWPFIITLSNGIIGVSVLAMPFCMRECGVILGTLLLAGSGALTKLTCHTLVAAAFHTRCRTYETLALKAGGTPAKRAIEALTCAFLLSTLCAFFVVMGDLGPAALADAFGFVEGPSPRLRFVVLLLVALFVVLPLCLMRRVESLSGVSSLAVVFYGLFILRLIVECAPRLLLTTDWMAKLSWWRPGGVLRCLPIFALSLSCQTQLFVLANSMKDPSLHSIDAVTSGAVNLCSFVYFSVGILGYISYHEQPITGDILLLLPTSLVTQLLKMGFLMSIAVSFPIMLFPCRQALYNILQSHFNYEALPFEADETSAERPMPESSFRFLTIFLLAFTLIVALLIPNVEFILGITGSLIGSTICIILPCLFYLMVTNSSVSTYYRFLSKICLLVGVFMLIACTFATLRSEPGLEHQQSAIAHNIPAAMDENAIIKTEAPKKVGLTGSFDEKLVKRNILQHSPPDIGISKPLQQTFNQVPKSPAALASLTNKVEGEKNVSGNATSLKESML